MMANSWLPLMLVPVCQRFNKDSKLALIIVHLRYIGIHLRQRSLKENCSQGLVCIEQILKQNQTQYKGIKSNKTIIYSGPGAIVLMGPLDNSA